MDEEVGAPKIDSPIQVWSCTYSVSPTRIPAQSWSYGSEILNGDGKANTAPPVATAAPTIPPGPVATAAPSVNQICSGSLALDRLSVDRNDNQLKVSFNISDNKFEQSAKYIVIVPTHNNSAAKKDQGDKRIPWGCSSQSNAVEFQSYKTSNLTEIPVCPTIKSVKYCQLYISTTIKKIRDEANGVVIIGLNANRQRVFFRYKAFGERLEGTFTGHLWSWACSSREVGLPIAESALVFSKLGLDALSNLPDPAGKIASLGGLGIEVGAIANGIDIKTGKVQLTFGAQVEAATELAAGKAADKLQKKLIDKSGLVLTRLESARLNKLTKRYDVAYSMYVAAEDAKALINSLTSFTDRRKELKKEGEACKVWSGNS
jgi:hypothetical protein